MPSKSQAQQAVAAIAKHHPEQLYDRNKGMASMSVAQLNDFASTPVKNKPQHVKPVNGHKPIHNLKHYAHPKRSR